MRTSFSKTLQIDPISIIISEKGPISPGILQCNTIYGDRWPYDTESSCEYGPSCGCTSSQVVPPADLVPVILVPSNKTRLGHALVIADEKVKFSEYAAKVIRIRQI